MIDAVDPSCCTLHIFLWYKTAVFQDKIPKLLPINMDGLHEVIMNLPLYHECYLLHKNIMIMRNWNLSHGLNHWILLDLRVHTYMLYMLPLLACNLSLLLWSLVSYVFVDLAKVILHSVGFWMVHLWLLGHQYHVFFCSINIYCLYWWLIGGILFHANFMQHLLWLLDHSI